MYERAQGLINALLMCEVIKQGRNAQVVLMFSSLRPDFG